MSLALRTPSAENARRAIKCCLLLLVTASVIILTHQESALASGTIISAPSRTDMVYDDLRGILYITNGSSVLRYKVSTSSFLSPFVLGGQLKGIDISADGKFLAVADQSYTATEVWIHWLDLRTGAIKKLAFPRAFYEGGTFTVAFGNNDSLLVSSRFLGSGWVPLRRYDPTTKVVTNLATIGQDAMLSASADGSVIGFAESNGSWGSFGRYRVADGDLLRKASYTDGTGGFNYEIATNRNGSQYAIPIYTGTWLVDANLLKQRQFGGVANGVVYDPTQDVIYIAWSGGTTVSAYDSIGMTKLTDVDFQNLFDAPGNHAFTEGRLKMSRDGRYLFATVAGGVRYVDMKPPLRANSASVAVLEDSTIPVTLSGTGTDMTGPLTYWVVSGPGQGMLYGTNLTLTYAPVPNYYGSDRFQFTANNDSTESAPATVLINVIGVNDAPSFRLPRTSITIGKDTRARTIPRWATDISRGAANESRQGLAFSVTVDRPWLFSTRPTINSYGTLVLGAAAGKRGRARVTVVARDSGNTLNGGINRSKPRQFTVVVSPP